MTSDSTPAFEIEKEALKTEIETGIQSGVDHLENKAAKRKDGDKYHTGASENTSNVFSAWCRMLGGQLFLLIMNAWCLRLFTSMVGSFLANPLSV